MKKPAVIASVVMFAAPFLLLAYSYSTLPVELPMMRFPMADAPTFAAKSPFTVFRVPVMNLTHGAMAAFMLAHTDDF